MYTYEQKTRINESLATKSKNSETSGCAQLRLIDNRAKNTTQRKILSSEHSSRPNHSKAINTTQALQLHTAVPKQISKNTKTNDINKPIQLMPWWKKIGIGALTVGGGIAAGLGAVALGATAGPAIAAGLAGAAVGGAIGYGLHRLHNYVTGRNRRDYGVLDDDLERGDAREEAVSERTSSDSDSELMPVVPHNPHAFGADGARRWNHRGVEKWREFVDEVHANHRSGPFVYDRTGPGGHRNARRDGGGEPGAIRSFMQADRQAQGILAQERPLDARDYEALHTTVANPLRGANRYRTDTASWQTDSPMTGDRRRNLEGLGLTVTSTDEGRHRMTTGPAEANPAAWRDRINQHFADYYRTRDGDPTLAAARFARRMDAEHAFNDGTGRVNRLMMNMLLTQGGGHPVTIGHTNMPTEMSDAEFADYLRAQQAATVRSPRGGERDVRTLGEHIDTVSNLTDEAERAHEANDHFTSVLINQRQLPAAERALGLLRNTAHDHSSSDESSDELEIPMPSSSNAGAGSHQPSRASEEPDEDLDWLL